MVFRQRTSLVVKLSTLIVVSAGIIFVLMILFNYFFLKDAYITQARETALGEDVHRLFLEITSLGKPLALNKLIDSPFHMHKIMAARIHREAQNARSGKEARIIGEMNQLTEPEIIKSLYEASQAGVNIDLIVRACAA
jgi:polyphosphate kinase